MKKILGFMFLLNCLIFSTSLLFSTQIAAQKRTTNTTTNPYDEAPKPKKDYPSLIHKLTETGLPPDLIKAIQRYNKSQMDSLKEDYHENTYEDGVEYIIKTMLRFVDGHIIGFIKKEPTLQDGPGEFYKTMIDIPLEWCGFDSLHQEHCVKNLKEMAEFDGEIKPQDWHQKPDPSDVVKEISESNINLLQLLDSKKGRRKLKSLKMSDSLSNVMKDLTGEDSIYALKKFAQLQKLIKPKNSTGLNDSLIASLTNGLTGKDSIAAIKNYLVIHKAIRADKKRLKAGFYSDSALSEVTKGLSGVDSLNALKRYVGLIKEPKKPKGKKGITDNIEDSTLSNLTKGLSGEDSINAIKSYTIANKPKKGDKKKKKKGEEIHLISDSTTTAEVTPPPTVIAKKDKKKKKPEKVFNAPEADTSSLKIEPTKEPVSQPVAIVPKKDKKKKKTQHVFTDSDSDSTNIKPVTPEPVITENKKEKKKKKSETVITPTEEVVNNTTKPTTSTIPAPIITPTPPPVIPIIKKDSVLEQKPQRIRVLTQADSLALNSSTQTIITPKKDSVLIETKKDITNNLATNTVTKTVDTVKAIIPQPVEKKPEIVNNRTTIKDTVTKTVDTVKAIPPIIPTPAQEIKKDVIKTTDSTASKTASIIKPTTVDSIAKNTITPDVNKDTAQQTAPIKKLENKTSDIVTPIKDSTAVAPPIVPPVQQPAERVRLKVENTTPTDSLITKRLSTTLTTDSLKQTIKPIVDSSKQEIKPVIDSTKKN